MFESSTWLSNNLTSKNFKVLPCLLAPNEALHLGWPCLPHALKSSTLSITVTRLSATKNAAKLAVYDETMIIVKNHHAAEAKRTDAALKMCKCVLVSFFFQMVQHILWYLLDFNFWTLLQYGTYKCMTISMALVFILDNLYGTCGKPKRIWKTKLIL